MEASLVAIFVGIFVSMIIVLSENPAAQDKARARRLAEARMNARLLRLDI
jgi:hypothetical protein